MAGLLRLLRNSGIKDVPLADIKGMQKYLDQGLGRVSDVKTALQLGDLTTRAISRDMNLDDLEARKVRRQIQLLGLLAIDPATMPVNTRRKNFWRDQHLSRYPRLDDMMRSAGVWTVGQLLAHKADQQPSREAGQPPAQQEDQPPSQEAGQPPAQQDQRPAEEAGEKPA
jgi:hypothetical protein